MLSSSTTESVSEICSTGLSIDSPMRLNGITAYSAYAEYRNTRAFQPVHCLFTENELCS